MSEQRVFLCYLIITTDTQTQTSPNHFQSLWKLYRVRQCLRKSAKSGCESCMSLRRMWSAAYAHSTSLDKGYLHSNVRDSRDFSWKTQGRGQSVWQDLILPCLVMSVQSISTNKYVTVVTFSCCVFLLLKKWKVYTLQQWTIIIQYIRVVTI